MTGTIRTMSPLQTDGTVTDDADGMVYPVYRGSNYNVNFDMLNVGMRVDFSVVVNGGSAAAVIRAMI